MARMKKADLVAKIAKEQGLDPKDLDRLPMVELEKMDHVVPDSESSIDDDSGNDKESSKKPEDETIMVDVGLENKIPCTFKVEVSHEEKLRKTPGKYRKFIY